MPVEISNLPFNNINVTLSYPGVFYPASRAAFDLSLPNFSRKIEGGSACRVGVFRVLSQTKMSQVGLFVCCLL